MLDRLRSVSETPQHDALTDPFGRAISYLRVSVTDRCDYRCLYCMSEHMTFLPKQDLLTLEELDRLCSVFVEKGVKKLRITGGEPLVRRNIMTLFQNLSRHLASGALEELTLTTNGSQLERYASELAACGVRRINVSLDTLDAAKFKMLTRWGDLAAVLRGIDAAQAAGMAVKINAVALKGTNEDDILPLIRWAHGRGMDMTFIEVMPMGEIETMRSDQYLPLSEVRAQIARDLTLSDITYARAALPAMSASRETGGRVGFITPLTHNFCESCNRVRVTCTGTLFMCLGQEDAADLRTPLASFGRQSPPRRGDRTPRSCASPRARFHHRPRNAPPCRRSPYEHDRRVKRLGERPAYVRRLRNSSNATSGSPHA